MKYAALVSALFVLSVFTYAAIDMPTGDNADANTGKVCPLFYPVDANEYVNLCNVTGIKIMNNGGKLHTLIFMGPFDPSTHPSKGYMIEGLEVFTVLVGKSARLR